MRLPFVWRPAPSAGVAPAVVNEPVGQVDLAPTFCEIAGVARRPTGCRARRCRPPTATGRDERVLCEWDSQFPGYGMHLRSIYRDGWLCTVVRAEHRRPAERAREGRWAADPRAEAVPGGRSTTAPRASSTTSPTTRTSSTTCWDDPARAALRADLVADLYDSLPTEVRHLEVEAPA